MAKRDRSPQNTTPDVHGFGCVHPVRDEHGDVRPCDAPTRTDGPHGWLCSYHDALVTGRILQRAS